MKNEVNFDVLGTSGLRRSGGYILEEFLRQLKGPKGLELLREFTTNNPQAGAIRTLIHSLVRQVSWTAESPKEATDLMQADKATMLVDTSMGDMEHSWHDFIAEALSMTEFGFAPMAPSYKMRRGAVACGSPILRSKFNDGLVAWRSIDLRAQDSLERWEFDPNTHELKGMWQRDNYVSSYVFIPIERLALFRTEKFKSNPEGRSLYRNSVIPYLRLKHIEDIEAIGVERDLTGLPTMQVPQHLLNPKATEQDRAIRAHIERVLGAVKRDQREYILLPAELNTEGKPTGYKFALQASPGQRQLDIVKIKDSYKTDILQTFLAQFLQMGVQSNAVGSFALASSSTNLFALALGALLDNIEETINRELVEPMCVFNGIDGENIPRIKHGDVETPPLNEIAQYLQSLFTTGMLQPSEKLRQRLYDFGGLPYEPASDIAAAGEVKTADQLIQEVMNGGGVPAVGPNGGVKTADQLIAEATGKPTGPQVASSTTPPDAGTGVKTADELIESVIPKK